MEHALLSCQNMDVILSGQIILQDVSFEINKNEIVALIGLNGSGKTTLLKAILGIYPISKGIRKLHTKRLAYVPQKIQFDRTIPITVFELLNTYSDKDRQEILKKLKEISSDHLIDRQVGKLSGGELQRVLIANALLLKPELLLLDEATAGIDAVGERNFYDLVTKIHEEYKMTIIIVSHDIHTIFNKATQIFCLHNRSIVCKGKPSDVIKQKAFSDIFASHLSPFTHDHA
jgi:zinc transport system ATP-binding protein